MIVCISMMQISPDAFEKTKWRKQKWWQTQRLDRTVSQKENFQWIFYYISSCSLEGNSLWKKKRVHTVYYKQIIQICLSLTEIAFFAPTRSLNMLAVCSYKVNHIDKGTFFFVRKNESCLLFIWKFQLESLMKNQVLWKESKSCHVSHWNGTHSRVVGLCLYTATI